MLVIKAFPYLPQISFYLTIHCFSSIFWNKHNMVHTIPSGMLYTLIIHLDTSYAFDMACETNIIIAGDINTFSLYKDRAIKVLLLTLTKGRLVLTRRRRLNLQETD